VRCPFCHESDDKVVDSRSSDDGTAIRRRRECLVCSRRYTTYERIEELPFSVRKRSGELEPFDRPKIVRGIQRAVTNRPIDDTTVELVAAQIEEDLRELGGEVTSEAVGLAVLEHLRVLDDVAYLRYASVYKEFEDIGDFEREVGLLQKTTEPKRKPRAD